MDALARDIQSGDGVANAAIAEAAERLREQHAEIERLRAFLRRHSRMDSPHMDGTANYRMAGNIGRGRSLWDAIASRDAKAKTDDA
jgi:hypothetical protein